jgi:hypothetical protein
LGMGLFLDQSCGVERIEVEHEVILGEPGLKDIAPLPRTRSE